MIKAGFIGTGNMGGALARAAASCGKDVKLMLANRTAAKAEALKQAIDKAASGNVQTELCDNQSAASEADYLFLGVKPQMMAAMLDGIKYALSARPDKPVLVTMAAGLTMDTIARLAGGEYPVIRIMPNTPAAIGEGMVLYCANAAVDEEKLAEFLDILKAAGRMAYIDEDHIDAGSCVSGCGPAFVYLFAEALADGGVACGLTRKTATKLAAQTLVGAAKLMLETGENPGKLKDDVCSPGGTTIQGVRALEEGAFRGTVMDAVIAAYEKTLELK